MCKKIRSIIKRYRRLSKLKVFINRKVSTSLFLINIYHKEMISNENNSQKFNIGLQILSEKSKIDAYEKCRDYLEAILNDSDSVDEKEHKEDIQ